MNQQLHIGTAPIGLCHCKSDSVLDPSVWDLWRTKCHWVRFLP